MIKNYEDTKNNTQHLTFTSYLASEKYSCVHLPETKEILISTLAPRNPVFSSLEVQREYNLFRFLTVIFIPVIVLFILFIITYFIMSIHVAAFHVIVAERRFTAVA